MKMVNAARLLPRTGIGATAFSYIAKAARVIAVWHMRARERQVLSCLNDHYLRDIGLTRHEVMIECGKPFWRA